MSRFDFRIPLLFSAATANVGSLARGGAAPPHRESAHRGDAISTVISAALQVLAIRQKAGETQRAMVATQYIRATLALGSRKAPKLPTQRMTAASN